MDNQLRNLVKKWQPRLGLSHWQISVRMAKTHEMSDQSRLAEVMYSDRGLQADILIHDPEQYSGQEDTFKSRKSIESCIVHELVHLVLAIVDMQLPKRADDDMERAVVTLERALMRGTEE